MDKEEQKQLRKAIQHDAREALETTMGECNVETKTNEYEFQWRNGQAVVSTYSDDGPQVDYIFELQVQLVAVVPRP